MCKNQDKTFMSNWNDVLGELNISGKVQIK